MRVTKKLPFTLLEVMVCLVILSMITGVCLWKGGQFLSHHRFTSDVQKLSRQIEELHTYALCYGASIDLELFYENGVLTYKCISDEPLDRLKKAAGPLAGIPLFKVEENPVSKAVIHFHPSMGITFPHVISFHLKASADNKITYWINLTKGIPFNLLSQNPKIISNSPRKPE